MFPVTECQSEIQDERSGCRNTGWDTGHGSLKCPNDTSADSLRPALPPSLHQQHKRARNLDCAAIDMSADKWACVAI